MFFVYKAVHEGLSALICKEFARTNAYTIFDNFCNPDSLKIEFQQALNNLLINQLRLITLK